MLLDSVPVRQITGIICGKTADTAGIGEHGIFLRKNTAGAGYNPEYPP